MMPVIAGASSVPPEISTKSMAAPASVSSSVISRRSDYRLRVALVARFANIRRASSASDAEHCDNGITFISAVSEPE
jgi:hypothetical protein